MLFITHLPWNTAMASIFKKINQQVRITLHHFSLNSEYFSRLCKTPRPTTSGLVNQPKHMCVSMSSKQQRNKPHSHSKDFECENL